MKDMFYDKTTADRRETTAKLAKEALAGHVATKGSVEGMWTFRNPESPFYACAFWFGPGVVLIWGDIGEFVLRCQERESLPWLLATDSHDYFARKIRAADGPRRRFSYGDAIAALDLMTTEAENDRDEDGGLTEDAKLIIGDVAHVRALFMDYQHDSAEEQCRAWHELWNEQGDDDPPTCMADVTDVMWAWEISKAFIAAVRAKL